MFKKALFELPPAVRRGGPNGPHAQAIAELMEVVGHDQPFSYWAGRTRRLGKTPEERASAVYRLISRVKDARNPAAYANKLLSTITV